jgi:hypothetical protein
MQAVDHRDERLRAALNAAGNHEQRHGAQRAVNRFGGASSAKAVPRGAWKMSENAFSLPALSLFRSLTALSTSLLEEPLTVNT